MPVIETTSGPVEIADLGRTMSHEHLHVGSEGLRKQWPHLYGNPEQDLAQVVKEVRRAQERGVATICDPACMYLDRDVRVHIEAARETGMRFVLATGIYGEGHMVVPAPLHARRDWEDIITGLFLHDLQVGIQGTEVRAGFLKCAADHAGMTPDMETVHRAVARASLETGAPVMAHSNPRHETGLLSMGIFTEMGVPAERIVIAHTGDTDDVDYIVRLLETGCYIGLDRYGTDIILSDELRNQTLLALVERGYGGRMMLGHDAVLQLDIAIDVDADMANYHVTHIFDTVIPELTAAGVDPAVLDGMVGATVHAWLAGERND